MSNSGFVAKRSDVSRDDRIFAVTVRQILRVNYAGEYGAIRIYRAQIAVGRFLFPSVVPLLDDIIRHEYRHASLFFGLMPARATRPCGATPLWGVGGTLLGLITGLLGTNAVMVCTVAVERTVHAHLGKQIAWLGGRDPELGRAIQDVRDEEVGHYDHAQERMRDAGSAMRVLDTFVAGLTRLLIWCSTYGALTRMRTKIQGE